MICNFLNSISLNKTAVINLFLCLTELFHRQSKSDSNVLNVDAVKGTAPFNMSSHFGFPVVLPKFFVAPRVVFNSESQNFPLLSYIAYRLILPNLISASLIRRGRLLLLPRWSLSWPSVLKH